MLTEALDVLHRHHIVHHDIAPKNLLLCSTTATVPPATRQPADPAHRGVPLIRADERLCLADLGLSKDLALASGLTVAAGTTGFAPPEQREPGRSVDHRADIWAASALIVWLALNRPPDDGGHWKRNLRDAGWPAPVARVLARGLATRPSDRFAGVRDWLAALEPALLPPPPEPRPAQPAAKVPKRRRLFVPLLVVAALVVGAGAGVLATWDRNGASVSNTETGDGEVRTVVEDAGITITLDGPTTAAVGDAVTLTATVDGAESWEWVGPDGVISVGTDTFDLDAQRPGQATVRILAFDEGGEVVEATRRLTVTDEPG